MRFLLCLLLALALCGCSQTPAAKETGPTGKILPSQNVGIIVFKDFDTCRRADLLARSPNAQNNHAFKTLTESDKAVEILTATSVRVLDKTGNFAHLRILDGLYEGLAVWCPGEDVQTDDLTLPSH